MVEDLYHIKLCIGHIKESKMDNNTNNDLPYKNFGLPAICFLLVFIISCGIATIFVEDVSTSFGILLLMIGIMGRVGLLSRDKDKIKMSILKIENEDGTWTEITELKEPIEFPVEYETIKISDFDLELMYTDNLDFLLGKPIRVNFNNRPSLLGTIVEIDKDGLCKIRTDNRL